MKQFKHFGTPKTVRAIAAGLFLVTLAASAQAAAISPNANAQRHAQWRAAISATSVPGSGCFTAHYPDKTWIPVPCAKAPDRHYYPAHGLVGPTVGNGHDYAAQTSTLISSAVGSFASTKDFTSVSAYSLQLNSQYFSSPLCAGAQNPLDCEGWQQFIYAPSENSDGFVFMEYWLINYGPKCPSGWFFGGLPDDCTTDSDSTEVPPQTLKQLIQLQLSGTVVSGGDDTIKLTSPNDAYSATGPDSVVGLAGYWNGAEYNIFGNGEDSEAMLNKGAKLEVQIQLEDGSTTAPTCEPEGGTTGETNNLTLRKCTGSGGKEPFIRFLESD